MLPTLEDMFASVILVTSPESPAIREKVYMLISVLFQTFQISLRYMLQLCQCLLEWLHLTNDANIRNYIIGNVECAVVAKSVHVISV